jgi:hypothetical protein
MKFILAKAFGVEVFYNRKTSASFTVDVPILSFFNCCGILAVLGSTNSGKRPGCVSAW